MIFDRLPEASEDGLDPPLIHMYMYVTMLAHIHTYYIVHI